jgi:flagellar M-ring protein FliF
MAAETGQNLSVARGGPLAALQALAQLPVLRQLGVMAGIAASVALGVWVVKWAWTPGYTVLYANLPPKESSEVIAALGRAGVPHRLDAQGAAVLVPPEDLHRARIALASEGLPQSADLGFEILHREPDLGTSQFLEQARYQRALEVELARSIATLTSVEKARVHLALPKQSAFVRERKRPSASVLVHLYPGRSLEESQVGAVAHLVSASVPGLEAADVRVLDQKGRLLTTAEPSRDALFTQQEFDHTRRLEAYYIKRIEDILSPVLGPDGVRAQVVADVDFTRVEETRETYNPELTALRSEQVSEESRTGGALGGVPGALSNTPPGAGAAPEQAAARPPVGPPGPAQPGAAADAQAVAGGGAGPQGANSTSRRYTRNFEVDRTVSHSTQPGWTLRRLSVAVVLDDLRAPGADGQPTRRALNPEELDRFTGLVKEAIGFSAERGDSVNVVNVAFMDGVPGDAVEAPSLWQSSWLWTVGRQALGVMLVLVLALGVLRPAMRRLASQAPALAAPALAGRAARYVGGPQDLDEDHLSLSGGPGASLPRGAGRENAQQQAESLRSLVGQDPKRVAQVVRNWIAEDE